MKTKYVKQYHCPSCGSDNLMYKQTIFDDRAKICQRLYQCEDCLFDGEENYILKFDSHQFLINNEEGYDMMYTGESLLQDRLSFAQYQAKYMKGKKKK